MTAQWEDSRKTALETDSQSGGTLHPPLAPIRDNPVQKNVAFLIDTLERVPRAHIHHPDQEFEAIQNAYNDRSRLFGNSPLDTATGESGDSLNDQINQSKTSLEIQRVISDSFLPGLLEDTTRAVARARQRKEGRSQQLPQ